MRLRSLQSISFQCIINYSFPHSSVHIVRHWQHLSIKEKHRIKQHDGLPLNARSSLNSFLNEIKWNANLMQPFIYWSFLSSTWFGRIRPSSGALDVKVAAYGFLHPVCRWVVVLTAVGTAPSKLYTRPTQRLSGPPPNYKPGAENHMLQL